MMRAMPSKVCRVLSLALVLASSTLVAGVAEAQTTTKSDSKKKDDKKDEKKEETGASASISTDTTPAPAASDAPDKKAIVVQIEGGVTRPDIGGLSDSTNLDKTAANGGLYGAQVGYRHDKLIYGLHFRGDATTEFTLWSLMAEIGYALPMRPFQLQFFGHLGYIWSVGMDRGTYASALPQLNTLPPDVSVKGGILGIEAVGMYWLARNVGLGPFLGFDVAYYSRPQVGLPQSLTTLPEDVRNNKLYTDSGSGLGYTISIGLRAALDLGI
jgi:hypothetical protein